MPTAQPPKSTLRFSGGVFTLSILRLADLSPEGLAQELAAQGAALQLLQGAPLVLDLGECSSSITPYFAELLSVLRAQGCLPIGVRNANAALAAAAAAHGLPQLRGREEPTSAAAPPPVAQAAGGVLQQGLRSGQRHYARGGDLVCLGAVNAGAEVLADGHIHVYGPLRGRALAGVQGDESAHIFCQRLEAELIAIAGVYINLDAEHPLWGKAAQVSLEGEHLHIIALAK